MGSHFYKYSLAIIVFLLVLSHSMAQVPRLYTTADGLPTSHIQHMRFDQNDFLWVSTDLGLARFNGERFSVFQAEYGNPLLLQENQVNKLHIDRDGNYWLAGSDGLYFLNHTRNSFTRYSINPQRHDISVSGICDHPLVDHRLIITTYGWGIHVFDTQACSFDSVLTAQLQSLLVESPVCIHIDRFNRLWAFKDHDIDVINLNNMVCTRVVNNVIDPVMGGGNVMFVAEDTLRNTLYMATMLQGLLRADLNTMQIDRVPTSSTKITALAMSPDHYLVIGTESQGLWNYNPDNSQMVRIRPSVGLSLDQAKVHSIAFDSQKNLWLGIYQKGVMVLPRQDGIFRRTPVSYLTHEQNADASVTAFAAMPDGGRAYGLDGAGVVINYADREHYLFSQDNSPLTTDAILSLAAVPDGTLLIGTYQCGVFVVGKDRKLRRDERFHMLERASVTDFETDSINRQLYIATNGQGLYVYDYNDQTVRHVDEQNNGLRWLNNLYLCRDRRLWVSRADHLSCINLNTGEFSSPKQPRARVVINGFAETSDGRLWLASNYGLLRYDQATDSLIRIDDDDDPHRRPYAALMNSEDGRLWLASAGCISAYDTVQHRFVHYNDPLVASVGTINFHSSKRWPDGSFSYGGDNGMISFVPEELDNYRHPSRKLLLTSLWVDNVPTDYDPSLGEANVLDQALWCADSLTLPSQRASFSVSYTLQDFSGETGIAYSYRLRGYESEWHHDHGGGKTANYQSLPPGDYVLEIRAMHETDLDAADVVMRQLHVTILSPWYASWWARILWLLLIVAAGWLIVVQVMERRRAHHRLREAETERQVKEGKLNLLTSVSHEIKTPLTLIISPLRKMMARKTDPATQSVFEMMYRNSLRILMLVNQQMDVRKLDRGEVMLHVKELPLRAFLTDLMQYFSSMALSRHISYNLVLPEGKDEMTLWADPAQLDKVVMNLLSNAIKFVPDNGRVTVDVSDDDNITCISVYNSGSQLPEGQQNAAFSGIGLTIAREITELHRGTLTVRNLDDGVAFDIKLLAGKQHFTDQELQPVSTDLSLATDDTLPATIEAVAGGERLEVVSSATIDQDDKERELAEQLNDELREKQRMRERRNTLDEETQSRENAVQMSSVDEKLMRRVMDLIHKNMGDSEFSVETLSNELGISRVHLNRKLKELLDISPSALIKSVRLKQAALLLIQSNVTVAEVAYSVGFSSPAYFTTNFTQYYGMTPKEFTNTYTENPDSPELKQLLGK